MKNIKKNFFLCTIGISFICIMMFLSLVIVLRENKVNVSTFGALGDGELDDTESIQKAIDSLNSQPGIIHFPKGVYMIDSIKSIVLKDNVTLEFAKGTILKAIPNGEEYYEVLQIHDVENVKVLGPVEIQGEREEHLGESGEWGFGISVRGSNDIVIENTKIINCWGDGIYLGVTANQNYNDNIKIINPILENNRRQGISIISVKNLEIKNPIITNTNGTAPQSGIDIEPNYSTEHIGNIKIINLATNNNKGYGLLLSLRKLTEGNKKVNIYVDSKEKILDGVDVRGIDDLQGTINIGGYYYLTDKDVVEKPMVNPLTLTSTKLSVGN